MKKGTSHNFVRVTIVGWVNERTEGKTEVRKKLLRE